MLTRSEQVCTTLVNSSTTMSTHFTAGVFSRSICFLTIASNAMSGVNSPVLYTTQHNATTEYIDDNKQLDLRPYSNITINRLMTKSNAHSLTQLSPWLPFINLTHLPQNIVFFRVQTPG